MCSQIHIFAEWRNAISRARLKAPTGSQLDEVELRKTVARGAAMPGGAAFVGVWGAAPTWRDGRAAICPRVRGTALVTPRMQISRPKPGIGKGGVQLQPPDRGGGGVAVITKPGTRQKTARKSKTEREPSWRVLLHNDDVHTFDYVTGAIVKVRYDALFHNF